MRIRKRKVPLPFHLLSPVPIPPSFFSSSPPDPDPISTLPPPPVVQLSGTTTVRPIPSSDDNKAAGGAADFGPNQTDGPNRAGRYGSVGPDGIGSGHPVYPISWLDDGKEEFEMERSNVAVGVGARNGSKWSSSTTDHDPEISGQPLQSAAAPGSSSSAAASHLSPVVVGMPSSTWCKEYHHHDQDVIMKKKDSDNKLFPSRKRSSWSSSSPSSSSSSSYLDINRDLTSPNGGQQEVRPQGDQIEGGGVNSSNNDHKKKRSSSGGGGRGNGGGVLMEGSRCSRVNGRGWRCSQPTLVGYSLCEHHLGKGRMRSIAAPKPPRQLGTTNATIPSSSKKPAVMMISSSSSSSSLVHPLYGDDVRTDTRTTSKHIGGTHVVPKSSSTIGYGVISYDDEEEDHVEEEEKKVAMRKPQFGFPSANKKKSKLGTVKARSISSLLEQPDNSTAVVALLADHHHRKC